MKIDVIIPAYNEEDSIALVIADIPKNIVREIIVVDNNSKDNTSKNAQNAGATVLEESKQGYGAACLKGIEYVRSKSDLPDIIVFVDADYSDYADELNLIVEPIENNLADLVIGTRVKGKREAGAMLPQQLFGNWLATKMIKILYRFTYHDLGPFRAIKWEALEKIKMKDTTYGWTVEMQVKALNHHLKIAQIPVHYRKRKGVSKISGTIKGTILAGWKIITTIIKYR